MSFLKEIQQLGDDQVVAGVEAAIGAVAPRAEVWRTVVCHLLDYSDPEVLNVYLVSAGRLIRYQHGSSGARLTTCLPIDRVARVSEQVEPTKTTVIIETDADRVTFSGTGQVAAESDGSSTVIIGGNLFPAGWVIEMADPASRKRLGAFCIQLRGAISK